MKKCMSLLLVLLLLFSIPVFADEVDEEEGLTKDVVILFTSDVHCGVDQGFGYVGLKRVRDYYEDAGCYTLLVDDGDSIQGEPLGTLTKGAANIELMNELKYDIAIPGNHEFDYGMDRFLELTEKADFPYISCNFNKEGELVFEPWIMKEFDGVKIAFIGVTTPVTLTTSTPTYFQDENGNFIYGFCQDDTGEALYEAVQTSIDEAQAEGADYVIVMGHLGNEAECEPWNYADVISNTSGIDVLLDGHSHDSDQVIMQDKDGRDVIRTACGTKLSGIGVVTISAEDGGITSDLLTWTNDVPAPELLGISNVMEQAVMKAVEALDEQLSKVIATSTEDLSITDPEAVDANGFPIRIVRRMETNIGDLCADAYLQQSGADVAIVNGGGIRVSLPEGEITYKDVLSVHPFGNEMCVIAVTGQQLLDALEWGTRAVPGELGGFPQVAGMSYEIHTYLDSSCGEDENGMFTGVEGEYRVKNVMVGGEPLDLEKIYTVAGTNYMLKNHGDGYTMFDGGELLQDSVKLDNQVLMDYISEALGGVIGEQYADPYGEGRIVEIEEPVDTMSVPSGAEVESIAEPAA